MVIGSFAIIMSGPWATFVLCLWVELSHPLLIFRGGDILLILLGFVPPWGVRVVRRRTQWTIVSSYRSDRLTLPEPLLLLAALFAPLQKGLR